MPARNADVTLIAGQWTELTDGDVTAIRVTNRGTAEPLLQATTGSAPTNDSSGRAGSIPLAPFATLAADLTLAQLWPGVAGADRVFAWTDRACTLSVSHA